jgi:hypothetical protein
MGWEGIVSLLSTASPEPHEPHDTRAMEGREANLATTSARGPGGTAGGFKALVWDGMASGAQLSSTSQGSGKGWVLPSGG